MNCQCQRCCTNHWRFSKQTHPLTNVSCVLSGVRFGEYSSYTLKDSRLGILMVIERHGRTSHDQFSGFPPLRQCAIKLDHACHDSRNKNT